MSSHITTQQYYVTLKVFKLENTKYPDTKTQTYFSSLFRSFAITIIPFISFSEQHPQFIKWNYLSKHPIKYTIKNGCISFPGKQPSIVVSPSFFILFLPFVWQHL